MKNAKSFLMIIVLFFVVSLLITEYKASSKTIDVALRSERSSSDFMQVKQVIGGSQYGNKAFYFFLNKDNYIVGVTLNKGIFGWKHAIASTGTGFEIDKEQKLSKVSNSSSNDTNKFYYGLTSYENIGSIVINETNYATLIKLDEMIEDNIDVHNTYLWYTYIVDNNDTFTVKIFDYDNNLIDSK